MLDELQKAIRERRADRAALLLAEGIEVNERFEDGQSALAYAVLYESPEIVRALLRAGADLNARNPPNQDTALKLAAARGYSDIAKMLLSAGADPNSENNLGFTPLREAVRDRTAAHLELMRALIKAGADVNAGKFISILMTASRSGSPDMVQALIRAGAKVNAVKPHGTALSAAVEANRLDNVTVLLAHGADPSLRTPLEAKHANLTPLELARKLQHRKIVALLEEEGRFTATGAGRPSRSSSVSVGWEQVAAFLREHCPEVAKSLRKGATQGELGEAEQALGLSLPEEFKEFYLLHDGQKEGADPLVPNPYFSPSPWRPGP